MLIFVGWVVASFGVAWAGAQKRNSPWSWLLTALLLSPFFAILMLIAAPPRDEKAKAAVSSTAYRKPDGTFELVGN